MKQSLKKEIENIKKYLDVLRKEIYYPSLSVSDQEKFQMSSFQIGRSVDEIEKAL